MGNRIHDAQLEIIVTEQQVLVLGVDVYELVSQVFEFCLRYHLIVDEGAATTVAIEFASDEVFPEVGFNDAAFLTFGDSLEVCPRTHHQRQRAEDDTLTGTGFTCEHRKAVGKVNVQVRDQGVVLYV